MATRKNNVDLETQTPSFPKVIRDSELLLSYAASTGKTLDSTDVRILYDAIHKFSDDQPPDQDFHDVLLAYSRLSQALLPITADVLRQDSGVDVWWHAQRSIISYAGWILAFAALVVLTSLLSFVSSAISESIKTEIDFANSKAITLATKLGPSSGLEPSQQPSSAQNLGRSTYSDQQGLADLQQMAISTQAIYSRARQLRHFVIPTFPDPFDGLPKDQISAKFGLDPKLPAYQNFINVADTYQEVRVYAQSLVVAVGFWYGGIVAITLPIFYALLGVYVKSLLLIQKELRSRIFIGELRAAMFFGFSARTLVAVVGGTAISLLSVRFGSFGNSLAPLACAFLAGYFVESLIRPSGTEEEPLKEGSSPNEDGVAPIILGLGILMFGTGVGGMIWTTMNGKGAILSYAGVTAIGAVAASLSLLSGRRTDGQGQEADIVFDEDVRSASGNRIPSSRS